MLLSRVVLATNRVEKLLAISIRTLELSPITCLTDPTCSLIKQPLHRYLIYPANLIKVLQVSSLNLREPQDAKQMYIFLVVSSLLRLTYLLEYLRVQTTGLTYLAYSLSVRS